jgi:hypothetical protein
MEISINDLGEPVTNLLHIRSVGKPDRAAHATYVGLPSNADAEATIAALEQSGFMVTRLLPPPKGGPSRGLGSPRVSRHHGGGTARAARPNAKKPGQ